MPSVILRSLSGVAPLAASVRKPSMKGGMFRRIMKPQKISAAKISSLAASQG